MRRHKAHEPFRDSTKILVETMVYPYLVPDPDGETIETTWGKFKADNAEDAETLAEVRKLKRLEAALLGGGAQPVIRVTRF